MSSPQLEDGYTRIANEVLEAICRVRIPGEPRQVFDFIIRKTWGFGKKSDVISVAAFGLGTGLCKRRVFDALHWLQSVNLILSGGAENRTPGGREWRINKDYDTWNLVRKTAPSAENRTKQVRKTALPGRDTSRLLKKEIQKKDPPLPPQRGNRVPFKPPEFTPHSDTLSLQQEIASRWPIWSIVLPKTWERLLDQFPRNQILQVLPGAEIWLDKNADKKSIRDLDRFLLNWFKRVTPDYDNEPIPPYHLPFPEDAVTA